MLDKLNGLATIQEGGRGPIRSVLYKEGMLINLSKDISCSTYAYVFFSVLFMITFYGAIPLALYYHNNKLFGIMFIFVVYMIVSCSTDTQSYIDNLVDLPEVYKNIDKAIRSPPTKAFSIECFHYEERTYYEENRERKESVKVVTHSASQSFNCGNFVD